MFEQKNELQARKEILKMVEKYYDNFHNQKKIFQE